MKTLITTLNSKYIHKSLALRLLYVACNDEFDVSFKEYTIKDNIEHIVSDIIKQDVDVVAFSVYIWNVELIYDVCNKLKEANSDIIIVLGGPEVSYEIDYFLDNYKIDYLISGEGEVAFKQLLRCIDNHEEVNIQGISSKDKRDYRQTLPVDLSYLETLPSPYVLEEDLKDMDNRILYFETSRGCPYQCQYCLSSLEKGLRFFSKEYLKKQLDLILKTKVKTVKLLDRSFNAKKDHALFILNYLYEHYRPDIQFQFEINADVLNQEILDCLKQAPKGLIRLEIGIQSTYQPTNEKVKRFQNFERLSEVIKQLQDSKRIDLHLDLIAGLPLENLERFAKSFDDVFSFYPKELQLGFLKLLRGTSLRVNYQEYGYQYDSKPPYEITCSDVLSKEDIEDIHLAEDMLEKYWNSGKMVKTMNKVIRNVASPFYFFLDLGKYYKDNGYKTIGYQNDELFNYLYSYLKEKNIDVLNLLVEDYLSLSKIKPKRFYQPTLSKDEVKKIIPKLAKQYNLNQEVLFRYSLIEKFEDYYLVAIYRDFKAIVNRYKIEEDYNDSEY